MKTKLRLLITAILCMIVTQTFAESVKKTYTFNSQTWGAFDEDGVFVAWENGKEAYYYNQGQGVWVSESVSGANAASPISYKGISMIEFIYNTNKTAGSGSISVQIGSNQALKNNVGYQGKSREDGTNANYTSTFQYATPQDGYVKFTVDVTTNSIYIKSISITYDDGSVASIATPVFTPAGGTYNTAQNVTISCATVDANIYYTTDGAEPSESSTLYNSPIEVTQTTTIKAIAIKGEAKSDVATATFTIEQNETLKDAEFAFEKEVYYVEHNVANFSSPQLSYAEGYDGDVVYRSSDESIATIDEHTGEVTIKDVGTTKITASAEKTDNFSADEASYTLVVYGDGVFDFTTGYDYGSGKSDTSENTNINEDEKIWTSGNVILKTSGRILWADRKVLILHVKGSGSSDKESACAISVDGGGKIKEIEIEGEGLERLKTDVANSNGSYALSNNIWKGDAPMVTLKHNNDNGVITIKKIKVTYIPDFVNVNIGTAEYITFCSEYALDFAGVTAYVVSEVNEESVKLEEIKVAPANTPVILNAGAGEYRLGTIETSIDDIEMNYLKVSDGTVTGEGSVYALAKKDGVVGFYVVDENVVIPKGKCYLDARQSAAPRLGFNFGEADAIGGISVDAAKGTGIYYNLSGQRVMKPSKGIYILNNKKVLVK